MTTTTNDRQAHAQTAAAPATRRQVTLGLLAGALAPAWAQGDAAQGYPNRQIRVVVPVSAGSATDGTARFVANALGKAWNTTIVVENRPGAGIMQGTEIVAKAPADGYTLLFTFAAHYSQSWVQATPYDPVKDFEMVAQLVDTQLLLAVRTDSPFKSAADVIAAARQKPGALSYGSAGIGTTGHMCGALFEHLAKVRLNHVPYKAASQVPIDAASGQTDMMFGGTSSAMPLIRAGRLRPLAVTGSVRSSSFPDVPTIAEAGLPGYEVSSPVWMMAPRGTPQPIIAKLSEALLRIAGTPEFREFVMKFAGDPLPLGAAALAANVPKENARWKQLVELTKASGQ
jgi:tripartite-type tricarboxylate transporter receptor subunit TctC